MARLYVVNCTGQNRAVNYRLDFTVDDDGRRTSERLVPYKTINVPARQQIPFAGELHPLQISEIVQQLEKTCNAVHLDQIRTAKARGVVKMLWSQDKPIPVTILRDVVRHNTNILSEQGAERRRRLAVAANLQMSEILERSPTKFEMEFEQNEQGDDSLPTPEILEEGLRVENAPAKTNGRRGRKSA